MKHSSAFTCLVSVGLLLLGCSAEDDPPPVVAAGPASAPPGAAGAAPAPEAPGAPTANEPSAAPTGTPSNTMEGQAGTAFNAGMGNTTPGGVGAGGANDGMADDTSMGGTSAGEAGGMNAAGTGTGGAEGTPPDELTLDELVGGMDGHLFSVACGDTPNTDDCNGEGWRSNGGPINACANGRLDARIDFPVGGEPGAAYAVRMHFYGVMEPRNYGNVVTRVAQGRPSLAPGGTPTPFASMPAGAGNYLSTGDNNYNTYELHVLNGAGQEVRVYFLNADTQTGHYTFGISYEETLELVGGGVLRLQIADANCRQIKNCGPGGVPCAGKAQTIDISAADPQPAPGLLQQPALGKSPEHSGQWFLLDVLGFEAL
jgi:hypothetical protein